MDGLNLGDLIFDTLPVVIVLCYGFKLIYSLYKEEKKKNQELQEYIRESDRQNIDLLKDFKLLLETIVSKTDDSADKVITALNHEASQIKNHIDLRLSGLEDPNDK